MVVTCRCSVMPTTRNIRSFHSHPKPLLVMCCTRLDNCVTCSGSPVYDDDIIEEVCENMGTIMFQLGISLWLSLNSRRTSTETKESGRGSYRNGPMHKLRMLSVVQTRGE